MTVHTPKQPGTLTPFQKFLLVILAVLAFLAFYWMTVDALDWQWERYEEEAAEFRESLAAQGEICIQKRKGESTPEEK